MDKVRPSNILELCNLKISERRKFELFMMFVALEFILAFSYFGFITIGPGAISAISIVVIVATITLGTWQGCFCAFIFSLSLIWNAQIQATDAGGYIYTPLRSGNPVNSLILSFGVPLVFALITGALSRVILARCNSVKRGVFDVIIIAAFSSIAFDALLYCAVRYLFPDLDFDLGTNVITFSYVGLFLASIFWSLFSLWVTSRASTKRLFDEISKKPTEMRRKEKVLINLLGLFTIIAMLFTFLHALGKTNEIFELLGIDVTALQYRLLIQILCQFMLAVIFTIVVIYISFSWVKQYYRNLEEGTRTRAQEDLLKAYDLANSASLAKSTFLANMSHDIRTPMNAIIGFSDMANKNMDNPEKLKECVDKISISSRHLLSLINEVLDMSRIETGKIHIKEKESSLSDVIQDFIKLIKNSVDEKKLHFQCDYSSIEHDHVFLDVERFERILMNLVSNSIKFTQNGGFVYLEVFEEKSDNPLMGNFVIKVKDTGMGMSKEFIPHCFDMFERERTSTVSKIQGSGLGLAITKSIIEIMGGSIGVESEVDKGTIFTVKMPLKIWDDTIKEDVIEQLIDQKVLIVDDDFDTCENIEEMCEQLGLQAEWTISGKEALFRAKRANDTEDYYYAYIIDWKLPDIGGLEVISHIRKVIGDDSQIYLVTSSDASDIEQEALENGADAVIQKPLYLSELRRVFVKSLEPVQEKVVDVNVFEGKKILLVEDNELNQEIACAILEEAGFVVDRASDGAIAVEKVKTQEVGTYDLILMDIQMPNMNGYEATAAIRALPNPGVSQIPIVAMTANTFEEDKKKSFEVGMNAHIGKPIDVDVLFETLSKILD